MNSWEELQKARQRRRESREKEEKERQWKEEARKQWEFEKERDLLKEKWRKEFEEEEKRKRREERGKREVPECRRERNQQNQRIWERDGRREMETGGWGLMGRGNGREGWENFQDPGEYRRIERDPEHNRYRQDRVMKSFPKLECYDGKQDWKDFKGQFERHRRARQWREEEAADMLALHLKGDALHYFEQLPEHLKNDLNYIMNALGTRFSQVKTATSLRATFLNMIQNENETIREYAGRLRSVAIEAFAGLPLDYMEQELISRFQNGCIYREASLNCNADYLNLETAVLAVEKYVERQKTMGLAPKKVRAASSVSDKGAKGSEPEGKENREISQLWSAIQRMEEMMQRMGRPEGYPQGCYQCGDAGHFKRDCPRLGCFRCGQHGHVARDCKEKNANRSNNLNR